MFDLIKTALNYHLWKIEFENCICVENCIALLIRTEIFCIRPDGKFLIDTLLEQHQSLIHTNSLEHCVTRLQTKEQNSTLHNNVDILIKSLKKKKQKKNICMVFRDFHQRNPITTKQRFRKKMYQMLRKWQNIPNYHTLHSARVFVRVFRPQKLKVLYQKPRICLRFLHYFQKKKKTKTFRYVCCIYTSNVSKLLSSAVFFSVLSFVLSSPLQFIHFKQKQKQHTKQQKRTHSLRSSSFACTYIFSILTCILMRSPCSLLLLLMLAAMFVC